MSDTTYQIQGSTLTKFADQARRLGNTEETLTPDEMITIFEAVDLSSGGSSGSDSGTAVQADYAQNDETAADYIKNRPFYEDTEVIFDEDVTTELDADLGVNVSFPETTILATASEGDAYVVEIDGTTYSCNAGYDEGFFMGVYLGNPSVMGEGYLQMFADLYGMTPEELIAEDPSFAILTVDTGEPFFIVPNDETTTMFFTKSAGTYHFSISSRAIIKFSSEFIDWDGGSAPSSLPEVTSDDDDKVLLVVDGEWVVGSIADGDEVAY